jgi:hypothetical protein
LQQEVGRQHNSLKIHCNAGTKVASQVATLNNYGTGWYCEDAIANILSLSRVKKRFPIRYDSANGNQCVVVKPDKEIIFNEIKEGLYCHDTANRAMVMVNTVKENKEGFTDREYHRAKEARRALGLVGYPSPRDFKNMVRPNMINNCTMTNSNINNANKIFGPYLVSVLTGFPATPFVRSP